MHALVLADPELAERERSILNRLEIGLVDDGLRVTHVLPGSNAVASEHGVYARVIVGPPKLWFRGPAGQAEWIAGRLEGDPAPDVVHVLGDRLWPLATALADRFECPLACELWSKQSVELAAQRRDSGAGLFAADRALFDLAVGLGLDSRTRPTAWGVRADGEPSVLVPPGRAPSLLVLGTGRDPELIRSCVRQIGEALQGRPEVEVFMDADSGSARDVWKAAHDVGLQRRLSIIDKIERARELVLHADMLIYPESFGEQRGLLLDAMGRGLAIIAARDEANSLISPDRCAVVDPHSPSGFGSALGRLLGDPEETRQLGRSAWSYVKAERRASSHVTAVLDAYEWLVGKASIPFSDG